MALDFTPRATPTSSDFLAKIQAGPTPISQHTSGLTPNSTASITAPPPVAPETDYGTAIDKLSGILANQQALTAQAQQQNATNQFLDKLQHQYQHSLNGLQGAGVAGGVGLGGGPVEQAAGPHHVARWIDTALKIMGMSDKFEPGIMSMIMHESGGNPAAINRTDSNAKAGHPSQGLMQTIPGTFQEYALPGYNQNILDPVSNIIAGVRYALRNYGKGMLLAGGRHDSAGNYEGY